MKIAIYGDSCVDPAQIEACRRVSPHLSEQTLENTWINMLKADHEVQIFSQMSTSYLWVDKHWNRNKDDFDINIIRTPSFDRPYLNHPDDWAEIHRDILLDCGPTGAAWTSRYQKNDRHELLQYLKLHLRWGYNWEPQTRIANLLMAEWDKHPNTLIWTRLNHNDHIKTLTPYTVWNNTETYYTESKNFIKECKDKGFSKEAIQYGMDPMHVAHIYHRWPYHCHPDSHTAMYNHAIDYIYERKNTPIDMPVWGLWERPHPLIDKMEALMADYDNGKVNE